MSSFYRKLKEAIYRHLIQPVIMSVSPIKEASLGAAIGMFVGLTPTVGVQMWVVFLIWLLFKYIFKIKFDLIIGTALVWISNPLTMFFLYYGFLVTGSSLFSILGVDTLEISYNAFELRLSQIVNTPDSGAFDKMVEGGRFLLVDLGLPMIFGSLLYAVPLAIVSYFMTAKLLKSYRISCATKMGLDYETWRNKFESN